MAELVGELTARLIADTKEFSAKMAEAKGEMTDVTEKGSSSFNKLASIGKVAFFALGAAAIGVGTESVKMASTFQSSTAQIAANAGISAKAADAIGNAFLATAGKTEASANEMAAAYAPVAAQLATVQGHALSAAQAQGVMLAAADLSDAKLGTLSQTTSALAQVMQAYGIQAQGAAGASDILFKAATMTGTQVSSIASAFARLKMRLGDATPPLSQVGGFMVDLAEHGITGSRSIQLVSASLTRLITPSTTVKKQLDAMGISVLNAQGKFIGVGPALQAIQVGLAKLPSASARATAEYNLFGTSSQTLSGLIAGGSAAFDKATNSVNKNGAAHRAAQLQMSTLSGQMKVIEGIVNDYGVRLGRVLIPKLELVAKVSAKVVEWFAKNKVAAIALGAVITGVLGVAITAFAVQTIGKLITNVNKAYQSLLKLFGLKGGPQATQPDLTGDATTAGDTLATAIDNAGKQLIADAEAAAAALESAGTTTGLELETGADASRAALETGGEVSRDAMETGGDTARTAVETGGDVSRDAMETGGDTARGALETGGDTARDAVETGGDTARGAMETGADTGRGALETGGDTARNALETGGDTSRTALETGGDTARDAMETGGDTARDALETGGVASEDDMALGGKAAAAGLASKLGTIAFGAIIGTQVLDYVNGKLGNLSNVKTGQKNFSDTSGTTQSILNALSNVPVLGSAVKTGENLAFATGAYGNQKPGTPQQSINSSVNGMAASTLLPKGTTTAEASEIQKLVSQGSKLSSALAEVKAAVAKGASKTDASKLDASIKAMIAKTVKPLDVAKTTSSVKETNTSVKAVASGVKQVTAAIHTGKPIQVHNTQTITVELDGKQVAKAIRIENLNNSRAQGQNAINSGPGRGTGNA